MRRAALLLAVVLPLLDLAWNLTHLNVGLVDFYGLTAAARAMANEGAWPGTPYFPAGYPLLLMLFEHAGGLLMGGYVLATLGGLLGLRAVTGLAELFELPDWTLPCAVALAWLAPSMRSVAGSPSVDALFTGVGLWFLWHAVALWRRDTTPDEATTGGAVVHLPHGAPWMPRRNRPAADTAGRALLFTALALPLLRNHGALLVVPVLLALWALHSGARGRAVAALVAAGAVIMLQQVVWTGTYGGSMPSAVGLQVRVGLEKDQPTYYANTAALFADYYDFAQHGRSNSIIADYGLGAVAAHTLRSWGRFLRRPTIAVTLLLGAACLVLRRRLPVGTGVLILWALGYTLTLSPAYYTPRGALLPELALIPVMLALATQLVPVSRAGRALVGLTVAVLVLYIPAGRHARAVVAKRVEYARISRLVAQRFSELGIDPRRVVVADMRITWLPDKPAANEWARPYRPMRETWMSDAAIQELQSRGMRPRRLDELLAGRARWVLLSPAPEFAEDVTALEASPNWELREELGGHLLYRYVE